MAAEVPIFERGSVMVSGARFVVGKETYAIRNVTSVKSGTKPPSKAHWMFYLASAAFLVGALIESADVAVYVAGFVIAAVGLVLQRAAKPLHTVILRTSSGDIKALQSHDGEFVGAVVGALNEAIIDAQ